MEKESKRGGVKWEKKEENKKKIEREEQKVRMGEKRK